MLCGSYHVQHPNEARHDLSTCKMLRGTHHDRFGTHTYQIHANHSSTFNNPLGIRAHLAPKKSDYWVENKILGHWATNTTPNSIPRVLTPFGNDDNNPEPHFQIESRIIHKQIVPQNLVFSTNGWKCERSTKQRNKLNQKYVHVTCNLYKIWIATRNK